MTILKERIEEILEELCHNTMGNPPYRIKEATDQILQAFEEILPEGKEIKDDDIKSINDNKYNLYQAMEIGRRISKKLGFNLCLTQIRERIGEK